MSLGKPLVLAKTSRFIVFDRPDQGNNNVVAVDSADTYHHSEKTKKFVRKQRPCDNMTKHAGVFPEQQRFHPTERLYMLDTYRMTAEATVLGVMEDEAQLRSEGVVLDKTIFHPQGGGQPSDNGLITCGSWSMQVEMVRDVSGVILHFGNTSGRTPSAGDCATLVLDADKRMLHAVLHSAGHAIDHAVLEAVGKGVLKPSKGYHFADSPYVEYEGMLPDGLEKDAFIEKLNTSLDSLVAADMKTQVQLVEKADNGRRANAANAESLGAGQGGEEGERANKRRAATRIVTIGSVACPCGGTHVNTSHQLNGLRVTRVKAKKGTLRVSYTLWGR